MSGVDGDVFESVLADLEAAVRKVYRNRLVSLAVFGSVGRGTPTPTSDVDLLIVAEGLPDGRIPRVEEFDAVDAAMKSSLDAAAEKGVRTRLSPVFKTPNEARAKSPLFLDMTEDAKILVDRGGFLSGILDEMRARLRELGSRRIWKGEMWYWDLKPDYQPGEIFEL